MEKYESKYDVVLDIIEHPENYTPEQLTEILSDSETREIYNLLCKTDSAIEAGREIDVDAEWETRSLNRSHNRLINHCRCSGICCHCGCDRP